MSAVPSGLRLNIGDTHPALKRGANKLCAYGAGMLAIVVSHKIRSYGR
jgi:hypothetical protein